MEDRHLIFRDKLIDLMTTLNSGESSNPVLRKRVGAFANELVRQGGARSWADLKERADGPTYDSLLRLFEKQSQMLAQRGDDKGVRSVEVLAISLIARRQYQADLLPGVSLLDDFILRCEKFARKSGVRTIAVQRPAGR